MHSLAIGVGATLLIDLWAMLRAAWFNIPRPNYGLVGRWLMGIMHGKLRLNTLAAPQASLRELLFGWIAHYVIGVVFATILLVGSGPAWLDQPTLAPAMIVGIGTVAAPFLLMQPGMGAGIASSRARHPWSARLQSLITHAIFGIGLYAAASIVSLVHVQ
jgi:hypothetical protein